MRAATYNSLAVTALEPASGLTRYAAMALLVIAGSAVTAIAAQFKIYLPFTPVPITGQTFAVLSVGALLGSRLGAASLLLYMMEGSAGLLWGSKTAGFKVFAGGANGWEVITGPTGGYIIGFIFAAFVVGWLAERGFDRNPLSAALAMFVGNTVVYVVGLPWLDHFFPGQALEFGLYPFIVGDAGKLLLAASLLPLGWAALRHLPGYQSALPEPGGDVRFGQYRLPLTGLGVAAGIALAVGAALPWGSPSGGHEMGVINTTGQVAMAAAGAVVALAVFPRPTLALLTVVLIVFGMLLPFDVLPERFAFDEGAEWGVVALIVGLVSVAALAAIALPKMTTNEAKRLGMFVVGAAAASACFYRIVDILEASEDFALGDLGAGLIIAPLAAMLIVALSLIGQNSGTAEAAGAVR